MTVVPRHGTAFIEFSAYVFGGSGIFTRNTHPTLSHLFPLVFFSSSLSLPSRESAQRAMDATYGTVVVNGHSLRLQWGKSRAADEAADLTARAVPSIPGLPGAVPLPPGVQPPALGLPPGLSLPPGEAGDLIV